MNAAEGSLPQDFHALVKKMADERDTAYAMLQAAQDRAMRWAKEADALQTELRRVRAKPRSSWWVGYEMFCAGMGAMIAANGLDAGNVDRAIIGGGFALLCLGAAWLTARIEKVLP